jgi:hypothetical protein
MNGYWMNDCLMNGYWNGWNVRRQNALPPFQASQKYLRLSTRQWLKKRKLTFS